MPSSITIPSQITACFIQNPFQVYYMTQWPVFIRTQSCRRQFKLHHFFFLTMSEEVRVNMEKFPWNIHYGASLPFVASGSRLSRYSLNVKNSSVRKRILLFCSSKVMVSHRWFYTCVWQQDMLKLCWKFQKMLNKKWFCGILGYFGLPIIVHTSENKNNLFSLWISICLSICLHV